MKRLILLGLLALPLAAQTTIYARASAPAGAIPISVANGTPPTVATDAPHGLAIGNLVVVSGMCSGTPFAPASGRSPYNGIFLVGSVPTAFTFTLNSNPGNVAIVGNGDSISCKSLPGSTGSAAFMGKLSSFTLGTGPYGFLDGLNGTYTRKLALTTANGLTSIIVTSGVAAVITAYNHGISAGDQISITGSSNSNLNTHNGVGAYAPHTVAASPAPTSTTFSFDAPGVPNGTYTGVNLACGPTATPNDLIGGTEDCLVLSQLAYTGNTFWDFIVAQNASFTASTATYKFPIDGGDFWPGEASTILFLQYGQVAIQFYVDRSSMGLMAVGAYIMNHMEHVNGVNWVCDTDYSHCALANFEGDADEAYLGASEMAMVWLPYLSSSHRQTFIDKIYNDISQYGVTPADISLQDAGTDKMNRLVNIGGSNPATGVVVAGTSTSVTLAAGDTAPSSGYVGNMIGFTYSTTIASITPGAATIINTATPFYGTEAPYQITLSGISNCPVLNHFWQIGNGFDQLSSTQIKINVDTSGCSSPTGGTVLSFPSGQTGSTGPFLGLITAYNSTTKIATVSGGFHNALPQGGIGTLAAPTVAMTYKIYQTITASTITQNTKGVAITGVNTHFLTDFSLGDGLFGLNFWGADPNGTYGKPQLGECVLSPSSIITDDTHLTADCNVPAVYSALSTTVPSLLWVVKAWSTGQGGMNWLSKYWEGSPISAALLYPLNGGTGSTVAGHIAEGANNGILEVNGHVGLAASVVPYDSRALIDLTLFQTYGFDYILRPYLNYVSGNAHSGAQYSGGVLYGVGQMINTFQSNLPSFPAIDTTGFFNTAMWHLYSILPDLQNNGAGQLGVPMGFAANSGDSQLHPGANTQAYLFDPVFYLHPASDEAKYFHYWLTNATAINLWTGAEASANYKTPQALILDDPRVGLANYNVQPLQRAMIKGAANGATNNCLSLTGWTCSPAYSSAAFYSKSRLPSGSLSGSWADRSGTLTYFGVRTWDDDHDQPQNGNTYIFKVGPLLGCDAAAGFLQEGTHDNTMLCDLPRVANTGSNLQPGLLATWSAGNPQDGLTPLTAWWSGNHGSLDYQYGDQDSKLVVGCTNLQNSYVPGTLSYATKCVADAKNQTLNGASSEQIVFQFYDFSAQASSAHETHFHVMQNAQSQYLGSFGVQYPEGVTTCPGSGGCPNLNTNRVIQSVEDGAVADLNPARQYGLLTTVLSPGTITLRDDNPVVTVGSTTLTTAVGITTLTPGLITTVQTTSAHNAIVSERVIVSGVSGTGTCNGVGVVLTVPDSTHYTIQYDSSTCSGPSGGTSTAPTRFNATAHGLYITAAISSVSIANPVVVTTATPHGLGVGEYVQIFGVTSTSNSCNGINSIAINDAALVTSVPSTTTFTIGFSSLGCTSPTGGHTYSDYSHTITVLGASADWTFMNTYSGKDSSPKAIWPIDADHFGLYNDPDTSAVSGAFNGVMSGVYFNGLGWSHRFSICGGTLCNGPVSNLTALIVHKVMQTTSDTTLTAAALNPDSSWTGAQTKDKVVLFARGGTLKSSLTSFTTTHSGTAQYMFEGFLPGVWTVTVGGAGVTGSPFTLTSAMNPIISFESVAGVVVVSGTPTSFSITTSSLPGASTGSPYSQTMASTGGTGSITWGIVGGAFCAPLQISYSTGVISGTPYATGTCVMTFSATDSSSPPITVFSAALPITVTSGPSLILSPTSLTFFCTVGGADPSGQGVSISASGVTLTNWSATKTQSWLTLSPSSGTGPASMTVQTSGCGSLATSTYTDTISVASTTGGIVNSPQTVAVTLIVSGGGPTGTLVLSPGTLSFSCPFKGASPASQSVAISASGVTLDQWSALKTQPWISLVPSSGTSAASMSVGVSCLGLSPGILQDIIQVSSSTSGITNSPQPVPVVLQVVFPQNGIEGAVSQTGIIKH